MPLPPIAFDNSYARELPGFYTAWPPVPAPQPQLLKLNHALAAELGLDAAALASADGLAVLSGQVVPAGAEPLAQAYAGHQFGGFSPQLGDGRALLLGELIDRHGRRRDWAFKGSGRTPYSRGGDGKAAVGPVLREYLMGEAMHALGIPTTRVLAAVATGEPVQRDRVLPGALLNRIAASHIRVGTFQFFAARGRHDDVQRLVAYTLARHDPELQGTEPPALALLRAMAERQAALIAQWMGVGFIHGVMNTDNMTLSGETIDYGPCAFMEQHDPAAVFSSIDHGGRYAYGQQPLIARWNIARLAECLLPLIDPDADRAVAAATAVIDAFPAMYAARWLAVMRAKLGLAGDAPEHDEADRTLAEAWLALLQAQGADHTLAFRALADAVDGAAGVAVGDAVADHAAPSARISGVPATHTLQQLLPEAPAREAWLARWRARLAQQPQAAGGHAAALCRANPLYIPRNHRVEAVLTAAIEHADLSPFDELLAVLQRPFEAQAGHAADAEPAAREQTACYQTFCGT
ncbi:protein adenylyltransferase SelO [Aquabacterium sp. OR-4]|uniref:protein adenylyltransferase SelO n=1 Tax=Aquabacterium sp. OR-4 TaxID=2978127 RepID=UPI0021B1AE0B|nr:YdiU family protein [Aquabacterium sp. OR-4]MDT7833854.1 YdiU family protein [Aquabacterium sp. OR-4]